MKVLLRATYLLFIILFLTMCGNPSSKNKPSTNDKTIETREDSLLIVVVNQFRMRDNPGIQSNIIAELDEMDELIFMGEQSNFTSKITLRGVAYDLPWIKVYSKQLDLIGWVFGGGVKAIANDSQRFTGLRGERKRQEVSNALVDNLSEILGIAFQGEGTRFTGYYHYYIDERKENIIDGPFMIIANKFLPNQNNHSSLSYEGGFMKGKKSA